MNKANEFKYKEQIVIGIFSSVIGLFTAWDLFVDAGMGTTINHIILEGLVVLCALAIFFRVIYLIFKNERDSNQLIQAELSQRMQSMQLESIKLREDNKKYKEESEKLIKGIGAIIDGQFDKWGLSKSEKEVALLLLKGLSHKEISEIRNTSEKTIRQQSSQVYQKSNLEGRAQLSAFFLEDLLLPNDASENQQL